MTIKAVILDLDGTLADTVGLLSEAWSKAASLMKIRIDPKDVEKYIGLAGPEISLKITGGDEAKAAELRMLKDEIYDSEYMGRIRLFEDVKPSLSMLRDKGLKIAVASSQTTRRLKEYLSLLSILKMVDALVGSDTVARRKPAPDVFLKAAELLGVKPDECFAVGDTCFDYESAKNAGMRFILVSRRGTYCKNAEFTVKSLNEAASIILSIM
ncbi:MAG: HAD family phosphatase [Candidatus Brockarchaeota archaeon]|nr:HAD family phosphatase [Candidatus Brockarchaeota archaeon]MBO3809778.1 HAD family phosphatase [Candidatus Brockarchaeota archaeon]MBO3841829.1 HAD family phosphatase [Candidatus Brockarchaeota archaeon]